MAKKENKKEKTHLPGLKGGQRVVAISAEPTPTSEEAKLEKSDKKETKVKTEKVRGKKYISVKSKIDKNRSYSLNDAINIIKETSYSKFDGTVELHISIKRESYTASVNLPHSTGKTKKIEVADENTLEKLKGGKVDFDVLLATADMMPKLVPFARLLGPKGLMPNPKNGTIIKDKKEAEKFGGNSITVKTEKKAPLIHTVAGKVSMDEKALSENIDAILTAVGKRQIIKAYIKATMSPSIRLTV